MVSEGIISKAVSRIANATTIFKKVKIKDLERLLLDNNLSYRQERTWVLSSNLSTNAYFEWYFSFLIFPHSLHGNKSLPQVHMISTSLLLFHNMIFGYIHRSIIPTRLWTTGRKLPYSSLCTPSLAKHRVNTWKINEN